MPSHLDQHPDDCATFYDMPSLITNFLIINLSRLLAFDCDVGIPKRCA